MDPSEIESLSQHFADSYRILKCLESPIYRIFCTRLMLISFFATFEVLQRHCNIRLCCLHSEALGHFVAVQLPATS